MWEEVCTHAWLVRGTDCGREETVHQIHCPFSTMMNLKLNMAAHLGIVFPTSMHLERAI